MGRVAALVRGSHAGGSMRGGGESAPQGAATLPEGVRLWMAPRYSPEHLAEPAGGWSAECVGEDDEL